MTWTIGAVPLTDYTNSIVKDVVIPSTRELSTERIVNRFGRLTRLKEDYAPLKITVTGWWMDGGGKFWRDFKAALLNQQHASFVLGDGTQFEWVDVIDVQAALVASVKAGGVTPVQRWAYTLTLISYEPFAREAAPTLHSLGTPTSSNGLSTSTFTYSYPGTIFAEPTWQFTVVVAAGKVVTAVGLQNTTTGETCTWIGSIGPGTWYLLMDAAGAVGGPTPTTPNNNQYGLLAATSLGRGMTLQQLSGAAVDVDFTGTIPTLVPPAAVAIPPLPQINTLVASITGTAALTSANLSFVGPSRWHR